MYSIQHYVIKFVSDLWLDGGFLCKPSTRRKPNLCPELSGPYTLGPTTLGRDWEKTIDQPPYSTNKTDRHDIAEI